MTFFKRPNTHKLVFLLLFLSIESFAQEQIDNGEDYQFRDREKSTYIQDLDRFKGLETTVKSITLNDVIEQGLRENHDENIRHMQDSLNELQWKDDFSDFWYPSLNLTLQTNEYRLGTLKSGSLNSSPRSDRVSGSFGLEINDYTIFNWGKDYLGYLNKKETYKRTKQNFKEKTRELKHQLIIEYFNLLTIKNIENAYRDQLRQASFIYRLNQEKLTLKKIRKQDYLQARADYLKAQDEYHQARINSQVADETFAYLIKDVPGTKYQFIEEIKFKQIQTTVSESIRLALESSPNILNAKTTLENAKRDYEIVQRERLPLPKISLTLGSYAQEFSSSTNDFRYRTDPGNSNIDFVAMVNASWSIWGSGGFFKERTSQKSLLNREIARKSLNKENHFKKAEIYQIYRRIMHYQNLIRILEAKNNNLRKTFDAVLENYMNKKTAYINYTDILEKYTNSEVEYLQAKYEHLRQKVLLAKAVGIEDFPGENFENLAVKRRRK